MLGALPEEASHVRFAVVSSVDLPALVTSGSVVHASPVRGMQPGECVAATVDGQAGMLTGVDLWTLVLAA
jgi:hypothetical protein